MWFWKRFAIGLALALLAWFVLAYLMMPEYWLRYAGRHPALEGIPNITYTGDKHPGDPINVALIGSEVELHQLLLAAGWFSADPVTLRSSLEIAAGTILERAYNDAPVSPLFLNGHKQDLAFEKPVGDDPRQRHHVRFWKSEKVDDQGRPFWAGSVTYDRRVGLSHTTGEITHHIAADIDAERDQLFDDLEQTGQLTQVESVAGFHKIHSGFNGGGDPWYTDGTLFVGTIAIMPALSNQLSATSVFDIQPPGRH